MRHSFFGSSNEGARDSRICTEVCPEVSTLTYSTVTQMPFVLLLSHSNKDLWLVATAHAAVTSPWRLYHVDQHKHDRFLANGGVIMETMCFAIIQSTPYKFYELNSVPEDRARLGCCTPKLEVAHRFKLVWKEL
jgi:hypothetical protein